MSRANPRYRRINPTLLPPTHGVYRARVIGTIEGQETITTLYYRDDDAANSESLAKQILLATKLTQVGGFMFFYATACSADWSGVAVQVDCPFQATLATVVESAATFAGGGPVGHEPTTIAAVIHRQTVVKGQCGRGHISMPAVPTAWVTASRITTMTAYTAMALLLTNPATEGGTTFTPCLYSKGTRLSKVAGISDVISAVPRALLGTVRRRLIGRGK